MKATFAKRARKILRNKKILYSLIISSALLVGSGSVLCYADSFGPVQQKEDPQVKEADTGKTQETTEQKKTQEAEDPFAVSELSPTKNSEGTFVGQQIESDEVSDDKLDTLIARLEKELPTDNGNWSVYVRDLVGNAENSINRHPMQAASLIKLYIMGAIYEDYETICAENGKETVDSNLHAMITVSDNDAANRLVGFLGKGDTGLGMQVVNEFCVQYNFYDTIMGRLLLQSNEFGDNYTSVADCGHFMKEVYNGAAGGNSKFSHAQDMLNLLAQQERRHKIPSQMPENVDVANKTGELSNVENDAAIIYNAKNDLIIIFMSDSLNQVGTAQGTIGTLSREIYDYYNS